MVYTTLNIVTTDLISLLKIAYKTLNIATTDLTNHFFFHFIPSFKQQIF